MTTEVHTLDQYAAAGGWSSHLFAANAVQLMRELEQLNVLVTIHRTVIYLTKAGKMLKVYVHYNNRSNEYATVVDDRYEVLTVHYTEFEKLATFLKEQFK